MPMIPSDMDEHRAYMLAHPKAERPDFEALREKRNVAWDEYIVKLCKDYGWKRDEVHTNYNRKACYCNCGDLSTHTGVHKRLCEHVWIGPTIELDGGHTVSTTCIYCKMPAIHHDMRCF